MSKALFTLTLLASALTLPLTALADPIDDFVLKGDGHTVTYSLPATSSYPFYSLFNFFSQGGPATIDGVSGYVVVGQYAAFFPYIDVIFDVPSSVFGVSQLYLDGPRFWSIATEPASNPPPYFQFDIVPTFIPGTYSLQGVSSPPFEPLDPPVDYTLTITQETSTAPTPEPSTLALLTTGSLGLIAFSARRKESHHFFD
jgi:PEP-CTERM motif